MNVSIGSYGDTPRANAMRVSVGEVDYYFSYNTCVAFRAPGVGLVVRENSWGNTTGRHLNLIDGGNKKSRLSASEFQKKLDAVSDATLAYRAQGRIYLTDDSVKALVDGQCVEVGSLVMVPL